MTLPATLQERDVAVARLAIKAYAEGDELFAHELCELHSHPAHAWRRIKMDNAPAPVQTAEDLAVLARLELERQRFAAMGRNDTEEVKRLSLELGLRPPAEQKDVLPPPVANPTTADAPGVQVHYRRQRSVVRRAADFVGERLPFGLDKLYMVGRALADGKLKLTRTGAPGRSPVDVFTRSK